MLTKIDKVAKSCHQTSFSAQLSLNKEFCLIPRLASKSPTNLHLDFTDAWYWVNAQPLELKGRYIGVPCLCEEITAAVDSNNRKTHSSIVVSHTRWPKCFMHESIVISRLAGLVTEAAAQVGLLNNSQQQGEDFFLFDTFCNLDRWT